MSSALPEPDINFSLGKGVLVSTDLRWRLVFILSTVVLVVAAVVLIITARQLVNEVKISRQTSCQNFHIVHPNLKASSGCNEFIPNQ